MIAMSEKRTVAVLGASGYTGAELLRLLAAHPYFEVVAVTASANEGAAVADMYPALAAAYPGLRLGPPKPPRPKAQTSFSALCPTAPPRSWCPSSWPRSAMSWTWPPTSG